MGKAAKICIKLFLIIIMVLIIGIAGLLAFLTITEYKPGNIEKLPINGQVSDEADFSKGIKFISWNVGYCGLGKSADFFMDGGKKVVSQTKSEVDENIDKIFMFFAQRTSN